MLVFLHLLAFLLVVLINILFDDTWISLLFLVVMDTLLIDCERIIYRNIMSKYHLWTTLRLFSQSYMCGYGDSAYV